MAGPRGKTADSQPEEIPVVTEEAAPLSPDERQGALADLLGADAVAPVVVVDETPAPEATQPEEIPVVTEEAEVLVSAVVTSTRFHVPTEAGRKTYRRGQIVTASREVIERGISIGCLKANA